MFTEKEAVLLEKLSPDTREVVLALAGLFPTAMLARFLWHRRLVHMGHRRFWSRDLVWEVPTAGLCAVMGGGLASYLDLDPMAGHALVGVVGWLGPRGIEVVLGRLVERYVSEKQEK